MANEITAADSNEITDTQFILTTDNVQGDPPGTTGTLTGPINIALQKIVNTLLYLKNRVDNLNLTAANASTTARGIIEIATLAESRTGTDTQRAVTPAGTAAAIQNADLTVANASTTARGIIEIATTNEATNATDTSRAMTPSNTRAAIDDRVPDASETESGKVQFATNAEAQNANNSSTAMTPQRTKQRIDAKIVQRTQDQYDAITNPDANILYVIVG